MEQVNQAAIVHRDAFIAVGLKWEGTFAQAASGEIRAVQKEMQERLREIKHVIHPDTLLGLSYHFHDAGFTHYTVVEVETLEDVPAGMTSLSIPALTYAKCEHTKDQNIDASYQNIFSWIEQQGYQLDKSDLTHFEEYPMAQDPYGSDPEFTILIPVLV